MFWGSRAPVARVRVANGIIAKMLLFMIIFVWDSDDEPMPFLLHAPSSIYCRVEIKAALELLTLKFAMISDEIVEMMLETDFSDLGSATHILLPAILKSFVL